MDIAKLREEIAADEGRRTTVYLCTASKKTVGIGHMLTADDPEWPMDVGDTISDERVDELFDQDIATTLEDCRIIFDDFGAMPEEAQRVFANMAFQLGRYRLSAFKRSIKYANESSWLECSEEILDSKWAKQTPNRAERLSNRLAALSVPV
jgi:lysozyme